MPNCPACGNSVSGGQRFCGDCGTPLDATSAKTETHHRPAVVTGADAVRVSGDGPRFIPGTTLAGRYRIVGPLGRGGMGEVYRADDLKLGQPVALKFLPLRLQESPERLRLLLNEVRLARRVAHPNVCRVYDVAEVDAQHFLSMEFVDGENLASLLRRIGRLPKDKAVQLARQICAGLAAAHDEGILHRDLKPSNIMIDGRGRARITDFGLAVPPGEAGGGGIAAGTPAYMSPEQLSRREVTVRSDLYALGLVLYELFTGRRAHTGKDAGEILRQRSGSTLTSPSDHVEGFDPAVERVIMRCLESDPAERPASALTVAAGLPGGDPLAAALAAGETPSPELVAAAGEAAAMEPWRAFGLAVLPIVLFVTAATLYGQFQIRAYLPMDKPPAVLVDRAREIIVELGYTEPVYADPADTAIGYDIWSGPLNEIRETDRSPDRWERLRDPRAGVMSFRYRQTPRVFVPHPGPDNEAGGFRVGRWNPFPVTTGEILVSLHPDGRLETFVAMPRRFRFPAGEDAACDWSVPFRLAGLDPADFDPAEPGYQRFMAPDRRAAWIPRDPGMGDRVEAGCSEGRLSLFTTLSPGEAERLAAEPQEFSESRPEILDWFFLGLLVVGAVVARINVRRGRADRRSAMRLSFLMAGLGFLFLALQSHALFTQPTFLQARMVMLNTMGIGIFSMVLYMAIEPYARSIWPSMLVSWTRLMGRSGRGWRDPLVGRAVLAGMGVGAAFLLFLPLQEFLVQALHGTPGTPVIGNWSALLGRRYAWAAILTRVHWGVLEGLVTTFFMVLGRLIFRRPAPAAIAAGFAWLSPDLLFLLSIADTMSTVEIVLFVLTQAIVVSGLILVLLRWGLVGAIAMSVTGLLMQIGATADWTAWHAQPAILAVCAVAALAAYGYWGATAGRSLVGESPPVGG